MSKGDRSPGSKAKRRNTSERSSNVPEVEEYLKVHQDKSFAEIMKEAIGEYNAGLAGNPESFVKAHALLGWAREKTEPNALLEVYYASTCIFMSDKNKNLVDKGKTITKSLEVLDRSVEAEDSIETRTIRAYTCLNIPTYFNRIDTAIKDFTYVKEFYDSNRNAVSDKDYELTVNNLNKAQEIKNGIPPHVQKLLDTFGARYQRQK
jgi:hypothetical protein